MKRIICLFLASSVLYSCGQAETPNVQVVGYQNSNIINQSNSKATSNNTKKQTTSTTSTKTTTKTTETNKTSKITKEEVKKEETNTTTTNNLSLAQKILLKSKQNYDTIKNYSATFQMYSKRNDKTVPKGRPVISTETRYIFEPPRNSAFDVVKHNLSLVIGAKMVWKGGPKAKVKASGVLGLFPMDLSLDDDKMTTNRNWRLDHLDHVGILSRALNDKAKVELIGKTEVSGKQAYMIQVKGTGLDSEVTHENIAIDAKDFFIIADEMYSNNDLIFQLKINIEGKNTNLQANTFEI